MTREELAEQATMYGDQDEEIQQLNRLKWMKKVPGLLEEAYDWLAMEIAQRERELFRRAL